MGRYTYKIHNRSDGMFYVGSTSDVEKRWLDHLRTLDRNSHHNINLQNAYNHESFDGLYIEVIYEGEYYREEEQRVLDETNPTELYNIGMSSVGGDNYTRHPLREDIKRRTSETLRMLHGL